MKKRDSRKGSLKTQEQSYSFVMCPSKKKHVHYLNDNVQRKQPYFSYNFYVGILKTYFFAQILTATCGVSTSITPIMDAGVPACWGPSRLRRASAPSVCRWHAMGVGVLD